MTPKKSRKKADRKTRKAGKTEDTDTLKAEIEALLESQLSHRKEKETHGEVFTPLRLVEELCDMFPASLWKDKDRTWLDPATGMGTFMVVVFYRLMVGLRSSIPSKVKRAQHIVGKMLYMVEINPTSVSMCRQIFRRLCPSCPLNVWSGDFLEDLPASWPATYDVVLGNPPYNLGGTKRVGTKRAHVLFTEKGLSLLVKGGYLGYICPPSYRQAGSVMNQLFQKAGGHLASLRILGAKETYQVFRIQGRVDVFVYQTGGDGGGGKTTLVDEFGERSEVEWDMSQHLPNFGWPVFQRLFAAVRRLGGVEAFRTTESSTVHLPSGGLGGSGSHRLLHLIVEAGRRVIRVPKAHSLENVPKVFVNGLGIPYVYYDKKGKYGPTQSPIVVLRPSSAVVSLLQSSLFPFIVWGLRLTGNNNLPYLFDAVPRVRSKDFWRELGVTGAEKKWIEERFPVPAFQDVDVEG